MKTYVLFCLAITLSCASIAQSTAPTSDSRPDIGNWWMYFGTYKLDERFSVHGEIQYRNYNFIGELEQLLIRTGLNYAIPESKALVTMGYGYILSEPLLESLSSVAEHRVFQQLILNQSVGRLHFSHRYRIEERWVENSDFKWRFRYFLGLNIPLNSTVIERGTWYAALYNEVFVNGKSSYFDRNRVYGGLGYKLNSSIKIQLGYMSQIQEGRNRPQFQISLFQNL